MMNSNESILYSVNEIDRSKYFNYNIFIINVIFMFFEYMWSDVLVQERRNLFVINEFWIYSWSLIFV